MLIRRLLTALLLIPAVILAIIYLPHLYFMFAVGLVLSLAAWEYTKLIQLDFWERILYLSIQWLVFEIVFFSPAFYILLLGFVWWLCAFYFVIIYPDIKVNLFKGISGTCIGLLIFVPCFVGFDVLHAQKILFIFMALIFVWTADTGAYFAGMLFGKHKLIPEVSPKKTIEGAIGGLVLVLITAMIYKLFLPVEFISWIMLAILTFFASVVGDLFESMVKRIAHCKDSGHLLPGHGGFFDRLDSIVAAIPVFTLGIWLMKG